jgi:cellulose synthase operon protein YhjQ
VENETTEIAGEAIGGDTPEDVAVLYSWANLQGAKYRDFSASRREYRAQLRLRAAEEQRTEEERALAEAEAAAAEAEAAAREAEEAARFHATAAQRAADAKERKMLESEEAASEHAMRQAEELSRIAAAERIEASRRAEAVAAAEAAARREAREMEEARASAERQAARYHESEHRRRMLAGPQPTPVPGQISDPYSTVQQALPGRLFHQPGVPEDDMLPSRHPHTRQARLIVPQPDPSHPDVAVEREYLATGTTDQDAAIAARGTKAITHAADVKDSPVQHLHQDAPEPQTPLAEQASRPHRSGSRSRPRAEAAPSPAAEAERAPARNDQSIFGLAAARPLQPSLEPVEQPRRSASMLGLDTTFTPAPPAPAPPREPLRELAPEPVRTVVAAPPPVPVQQAPAARQEPVRSEELSPGQRAYAAARAEAAAKAEAAQTARRIRGYAPEEASGFFSAYGSARAQTVAEEPPAPMVPAWLNGPAEVLEANPPSEPSRITSDARRRVPSSGNTPVAPVEALQHSRERVAARWFALKGVFDHGVQELRAEQEARRERERQVPLVGIFSLAGGVGKTSLVATLGRTLSATGERVLLTDTTSHGLLPFYFGASELRPGVVRTFSPPSGSADAPIYLVSYDVLQRSGDAASQDWFAAELAAKSQSMSRVILDLSAAAPWVARRLVRMDGTILVPLAPDMNSVISLGAMEKFFSEMKNTSGKKAEPFYVLNQFDSSLALHLDVREVLRQQLDDRLLPFVIRRAPAVPEALAEGMTVVDYAAESAVAEDYRSLGNWLRSHTAPARAGTSSARWSER